MNLTDIQLHVVYEPLINKHESGQLALNHCLFDGLPTTKAMRKFTRDHIVCDHNSAPPPNHSFLLVGQELNKIAKRARMIFVG